MPVLSGENADCKTTPPRKRSRLSPSPPKQQRPKPKRNTHPPSKESCSVLPSRRSLLGTHRTGERMLNGYLTGDSLKSDDSPCSEVNNGCPVATLSNLGNTCFLNSVLYTLRFAPSFLHNLHHLVMDLHELNMKYNLKTKSSSLGRNVGSSNKSWTSKEIFLMNLSSTVECNKSNVQITTEELHVLYESLHTSEMKEDSEPFQADTYLQSLRMVNPIFEGNQQHDAHELLVCLLNTTRETCQLLAQQQVKSQLGILEAANGTGVQQLDLALTQVPPVTAPLNAARWGGVRKSWKKKKERTITADTTNGTRPDDQELLATTDSLINGVGNLKPLALIAEDSLASDGSVSDASEKPEAAKGPNFIAEDFEGMSVLLTTCLECEHTTIRKEAFCDICVPIAVKDEDDSDGESSPKTVSGTYQSAIVTSEHLRDLNKYWCEQCLRLNEARRCVRYETLPKLLVLHLKRFSSTYNSTVSVSKINDYMPTPLTLACFCVECCDLPEDQRPHQYSLYGIIMHLGSTIASGHYVAYVKASDNSANYYNCPRDRRKATGLNASGGKGGNSCDKMGGFFKFFRPKSSSTNSDPLGKPVNNYYNNVCHSYECCGIKLNRSFGDCHQGLNGDAGNNGVNETKGPAATTDASSTPVPEPMWLECDDESVRPLTLKEFEAVLAPTTRRNSTTPYLLFYAKC